MVRRRFYKKIQKTDYIKNMETDGKNNESIKQK